MLSVTSSFLIRWFVCRPESREGEYPAHWWPCRFPSLQAVKKIKTLEKKPPTTLKQHRWELTPPGLTLRNVVFIFLTAGVNLVDGAHGSWRDEKKPKELVAPKMLMERHSSEEESNPQCGTIGLLVNRVKSASSQHLLLLHLCHFTCVLTGKLSPHHKNCNVGITTSSYYTLSIYLRALYTSGSYNFCTVWPISKVQVIQLEFPAWRHCQQGVPRPGTHQTGGLHLLCTTACSLCMLTVSPHSSQLF